MIVILSYMKDQRLITNFTCDECAKKSDQRTVEQGFPYELGWRYLFKLAYKDERNQSKVTRDKHFCCDDCFSRFIITKLKGGNNMPISREKFESGDFKQRAKAGENNYVLDFLNKDGKAYRAEEIAKGVKRSGSMVRQNLRKLIKKGLVKVTVPYYIAVDKTSKKKVSKKTKK